MLHRIHLAALAIAASSCGLANAADCTDLAALEWMLGGWQQTTEKTLTRETWTRVSGSTFEGFGESLSADSGERRASESLRLVEMQGEVFFVAKVNHNERPVAFTLTACDEGSATFENPQHDFPRKLEYTLTGADTLAVVVSDGGEGGFEIRFERRPAGHCLDCDE